MIEFFFMRHILIDKNWLFDDYDLMIEELEDIIIYSLSDFINFGFFIAIKKNRES